MKKETYGRAIKLYLIAYNGLISYGKAMWFAKKYHVKFSTINRFLQNESSKGREWGFMNLDALGNKIKGNQPWFFKQLTKKSLNKLKKEINTTILNKFKN